jgi:hypothetical protein
MTAVALDSTGIASAPLVIQGQPNGYSRPGKLFVLAVGIDKYPRIANADLRFAAEDAQCIARSVSASARYTERANRPARLSRRRRFQLNPISTGSFVQRIPITCLG